MAPLSFQLFFLLAYFAKLGLIGTKDPPSLFLVLASSEFQSEKGTYLNLSIALYL